MTRYSCYCLISLIIAVCVVKCEIHRARSVQTFKHRFRNVDDLETEIDKEIKKIDENFVEKEPNSWSDWLDVVVLGHSRRIWLYSAIASGMVGMTGLFPLLVIPMNCGGLLKSKATTIRLNMLLSFAVGGLLGDVFLHLLPEAWAHAENYGGRMVGYRNIGMWFLVGLLSFFFIEKLAGEGDDDDDEEEDEEEEKEDNKIDDDNDEIINDPKKTAVHHHSNGVKHTAHRRHGNSDVMTTTTTNSDESSEGESGPSFAKLIRRERIGTNACVDRQEGTLNIKKSNKPIKDHHHHHCEPHHQHSDTQSTIIKSSSSSSSSLPSSSSSSSSSSLPSSSSSSSSSPVTTSLSAASVDKKEGHIKVSGWLNLLANVVDNFTHGLAVAGSFCISPKMGVLTTLAILLHEIPHEIGDFAILLQAGFDRWRAAKAQVMTATGGIIGAMIALSADSVKSAGDSTAWILPFTAGGFINIALVAIVPDLMKERRAKNAAWQVVLVCTGIFVMGLVTALVD